MNKIDPLNRIRICSLRHPPAHCPQLCLRDYERVESSSHQPFIPHQPKRYGVGIPCCLAKRGVLRDGWGQCIAELVAAQKFNLQRHHEIPYTYGIVTSGLLWQFIRLSGSTVSIEPAEIPLQPLDRLLGILAWLAQN